MHHRKSARLTAPIISASTVFNIEVKRKEMEQQNLNRNEIIRSFESRYRNVSTYTML